MAYYIGLMSGTSMDAIDAVLTDLTGPRPQLIASHSHPFPAELAQTLLEYSRKAEMPLQALGEYDARIGRLFADASLALLEQAGIAPGEVTAIGSHGQTLFHSPSGPHPFTLQIGDPNIIAEQTGIPTVADFRRRDMAAGGQGAPLVPAFHESLFRSPGIGRVIVNIGGIANITILPPTPNQAVTGFDTGPGNCLMDSWTLKQLGEPVDRNGEWAAQGKVSAPLLNRLMADPYFSSPPPKSSGREYFNLAWLERQPLTECPEDVQATLCRLTAESIAQAITQFAPESTEIYVCGGGAHNPTLMTCLETCSPGRTVATTAALGLEPDWVEATAFAWLAHRTMTGATGNLPSVTGARHRVVLGAIYPGPPRS